MMRDASRQATARYAKNMKYGHRLHATIQGYDDRGRGLCRIGIDGQGKQVATGQGVQDTTLVVPFTCSGDQIDATFVKREFGVKICRLQEVTAPGPDRIPAPCQHAGVCGGCLWQHIRYAAQLDEKERGVKALFDELGYGDRVLPIVPADQTMGYRNRMDYCVGWNGEIGLKEYGNWNRYVDLKQCLHLQPDVQPILAAVRAWMKEFDLQPWDAKFHAGDVRYAVVRDGRNTGQRLVTIVVHDAGRVTAAAKHWLADKIKPHATSLLLGELTKTTDLSLAESFEPLFGDLHFEERVNGIAYRIHPNSFFQTNTDMAAKLQTAVLDALFPQPATENAGHVNILDLYCGLGFFGIAAAKLIPDAHIYGYEIDEQAIKLASQNALLNGVGERCEFSAGKAEEVSWKDIPADAVILDPPRGGLHPRVSAALLGDGALQPRSIVYVSCNYHRLKDELPTFLAKYEIVSVLPLDLFPQTPHVEVVVTLKRKAA